jgi:LEA14-like dessication related protein
MSISKVNLLIVLALTVSLSGCSLSPQAKLERLKKECTVDVRDIRVESVSLFDMQFAIDLVIMNPTEESLTAKSIAYTISLNQVKVGYGTIDQQVELVKMGETKLTVPVNISLLSLTGGAKRILTERQADCKVEGNVVFDYLFLDFELPFKVEKAVSLK